MFCFTWNVKAVSRVCWCRRASKRRKGDGCCNPRVCGQVVEMHFKRDEERPDLRVAPRLFYFHLISSLLFKRVGRKDTCHSLAD